MEKQPGFASRSEKTKRTPPQKTRNSKEESVQRDESTYPCEICSIVKDQPIVCCDRCNLWFHFDCAKVTSEVANHDWFCNTCRQSIQESVHPFDTPLQSTQMEQQSVSVSQPQLVFNNQSQSASIKHPKSAPINQSQLAFNSQSQSAPINQPQSAPISQPQWVVNSQSQSAPINQPQSVPINQPPSSTIVEQQTVQSNQSNSKSMEKRSSANQSTRGRSRKSTKSSGSNKRQELE